MNVIIARKIECGFFLPERETPGKHQLIALEAD